MENISESQDTDLVNVDNNHKNVRPSLYDSSDSDSNPGSKVDNLKERSIINGFKKKRILKHIGQFSDSDSDSCHNNLRNGYPSASETVSPQKKTDIQDEDSETEINSIVTAKLKSRIQRNIMSGSEESENENGSKKSSLSDSDTEVKNMASDSEVNKQVGESDDGVKNEEQQLRMKNKRNKLKNKFNNLLNVRNKQSTNRNKVEEEVNKMSASSGNDSDDEMVSVEKIKMKIKAKISNISSICDPDTSEEEENNQNKSVYKKKKERKTMLTSPKPQRMSAKQAMENMHKIKSESNRMLREKEVSLPYHRPKALSLKDIMSRRKLAVSSDGKTLPIKMNDEQLKHYAKMLEEKQKEVLELCKSESEEEDNDLDHSEVTCDNKTEKDDSTEEINTTTNKTENNAITDGCNQEINDTQKENCAEDAKDECNDQGLAFNEKEQETESMRLVYNDSAGSIIDDNISLNDQNATEQNSNENVTGNEKDSEILNTATKITNDEYEPAKILETSDKNNTDDTLSMKLYIDSENNDSAVEKLDVGTTRNRGEIPHSNDDDSTHNSIEKRDDFACNTGNAIEVVTNISMSKESLSDDENSEGIENMNVDKDFSDDDINMDDIDNIIENAEIIKDIEDKVNSQFLVRDKPLNLNPKLTGGPGMVIDLESDSAPKKSGVELLKERFTYFSKLKTPEEVEREREKKLKPGTQLIKLKQELEEKIAEQRSLEWAKRLEEEKQQQKELGGDLSDEDDIDKIEAAIEEKEEIGNDLEESDSAEEEPEENDVEIKDKPRTKNAMLDDEAEESDCNDDDNINSEDVNPNDDVENPDKDDEDEIDNDETESDSESESSDSEQEQAVAKKGRILKAFEDSDEEDVIQESQLVELKESKTSNDAKTVSSVDSNFLASQQVSQDDDLQLAQRPVSTSDDLFTSQESALLASNSKDQTKEMDTEDTFTQTFSILDSSKPVGLDWNSQDKVAATESLNDNHLEDVPFPTPNIESQLELPSQFPITQESQSQTIGEDIVALCTGQFYNNKFISQVENQTPTVAINYDAFDNFQSQDSQVLSKSEENEPTSNINDQELAEVKSKEDNQNNTSIDEKDNFIELNTTMNKNNIQAKVEDGNLKSILDELADPEFDAPKPNKYFLSSDKKKNNTEEPILKRKLIIDSDDEAESEGNENKRRKKLKKKKPEKRALQISDDEEEESEAEEEYESEIEDDGEERLVEYDSEENEIELKPQKTKQSRKMAEFFEKEAELTSEDEWAGSGDEDEAGLDTMEREAGDDDVFHQGALQKELGQIHMRDVLDQDKREVRLIQELLFEDGDLGGGGRQRKFKWSNMGNEEMGTVPDALADTQEEEFESEEQWRKQRHEREMFLRQMKSNDEPDEELNISINRTTIIKANLQAKSMSSILVDVKNITSEGNENTTVTVEKKTRDIPSPKKPFALMQQSYQGSLLARGRGALARLAALATPLTADDDKVPTLGPSSRRNFVFAAITSDEKEPKASKRKAESNPSTPKLVKKIRTEEKNSSRSSLLDHLKL